MVKINLHRAKLFDAFNSIIDNGVLTEGMYLRKLEAEVERRYGMHAIAYNSAGTGLFATLLALKLPARARVAVSVNTFYATGAMIREAGYTPVLIDADSLDFCMSVHDLQDVHKTFALDAVVLTHVGGSLARRYEELAKFCRQNKLPLVEDAAHAFGTGVFTGRVAGKLGTAAIFSFYPTKAVPAGDGGMIVTKDAELAETLRRLRNYGKHKDLTGVIRYDRGFNFRMDEWTAAVAFFQVERLNEILNLRTEAAMALRPIVKPLLDDPETNWYKYIAPASFPAFKTTGKVYARTDQLPAALGLVATRRFPQAELIADSHICLPIDEGLYQGYSTDHIEEWLRK